MQQRQLGCKDNEDSFGQPASFQYKMIINSFLQINVYNLDGLVFAPHKLHWLILQLHWDEIGFRILPFDISNFTIGFPDNSIGTYFQLKEKIQI